MEFPDNPVLVEVWRSGFFESAHRGSLVVLDAEGAVTRAHARIRPADREPAFSHEGPLLISPTLVIRSTTGRSEDRSVVPETRRL